VQFGTDEDLTFSTAQRLRIKALHYLACYLCQCCILAATGVRKAVSDYEELAKDADVDIVYVSNLHPAHRDTSILMMEHGKHVLCEKPLAVSTCLHCVVAQCNV